MTQEYDDTNTFVLFTNDKGDNPKRPDRTGKINIDGKWYRLSGWLKKSKTGNTFLSGEVQPMEGNAPQQSAPAQQQDDFDDDVPF